MVELDATDLHRVGYRRAWGKYQVVAYKMLGIPMAILIPIICLCAVMATHEQNGQADTIYTYIIEGDELQVQGEVITWEDNNYAPLEENRDQEYSGIWLGVLLGCAVLAFIPSFIWMAVMEHKSDREADEFVNDNTTVNV